MTHSDPETNHSDAPRRAPDLAEGEAELVAWFGHLDRPDAPRALRSAVLAARTPQTTRSPEPAGRLLSMFPLGGWGVATAALLLVAFGIAGVIELSDPAAAPAPAATAGGPGEPVTVLEDPTLALFHDLQTFDDVGRGDDELLADWVR